MNPFRPPITDPIASQYPDAPVLGRKPAPYDSDTLKMINRNAGKVCAAEIAAALCWPLSRLQRVARENRINLALEREREPRGA
jgi:hypothetical protein